MHYIRDQQKAAAHPDGCAAALYLIGYNCSLYAYNRTLSGIIFIKIIKIIPDRMQLC